MSRVSILVKDASCSKVLTRVLATPAMKLTLQQTQHALTLMSVLQTQTTAMLNKVYVETRLDHLCAPATTPTLSDQTMSVMVSK